MLCETNCFVAYSEEYEDEFLKTIIGLSAKTAENKHQQKKKELAALSARDRELDMLFERLYEDNESGKIDDAAFPKYQNAMRRSRAELRQS